MSDLKSKQLAADLLADTLNRKPAASPWHLWLGVIYPAAVIAFEIATRWCAQTFFDPMPTIWHTLAIAAVPASNLLIWLTLREKYVVDAKRLALASGFAIGIASFYTLIFLPLMPLAVVAIMFYGMGLLPMAPLAAFVSALKLSKLSRQKHTSSLARPLAGGIAAGIALLIALDVPAAATRLGVQWAASSDTAERERGLSLLRTLGDDDLLLRLCYDSFGRPSGLLSAFVMFGGASLLDPVQRQFSQSTGEIREIYYRTYGVPFNAKPAPFEKNNWARFADFQWDNDHGGTQVGGRIKGLDLVSSRMDGSINAADAVGYLEWIVEFRNTSPLDREARVTFALPPGAVVSRATLWVNGEEREAAYGGRGAVRAAYERVAVQQRRDPLLVTTKGADRVLAQAFPVPRNGGTIKFKIGITAPLDLEGAGTARLTLPAIVDRNFSFAGDVKHAIWVESKTPLKGSTGLSASEVTPGFYRAMGSLGDASLALIRPSITATRAASSGPVTARIAHGPEVIQEIVSETPKAPSALVIVIDGSARLHNLKSGLSSAFDMIPTGTPVGFTIASEPIQKLDIAPWTEARKLAAAELIANTHFTGGQDNTRALSTALLDLEPHGNAALIWVHGPQPITFRDTNGVLEQAATRMVRRPHVWLLATEPGPNEALPDVAWAWSARSIPAGGKPATALTKFIARTFSQEPRLIAKRTEARPVLASEMQSRTIGSDHIARLWAREQVLAFMEKGEEKRTEAVTLASEHRLVTPVSGAVVLETQQQYEEARLSPTSKTGVPTVPEPEEWALIILSALAFLWLMRQRQMEGAAAA